MNSATTAMNAKTELQGRIRASRLTDSLAEMGSDLYMEQVPLDEAFQQIQTKALECLVGLFDSRILADAEATKCCMDLIATESEQVAWQALEKGAARLHEGLAILEGLEGFDACGTVN